jgi:ElaB/YqjD/DUF883 family membrane-anchored ribosome-binding protein
MSEASVDSIMDDVRQVIGDVEELLRATAGQAGEKVTDKVNEARSRAEHTLRSARLRLSSLEDGAVARARQAAGEADRYVRDNPWQSIGIAAGIAFLVGVLVSRR